MRQHGVARQQAAFERAYDIVEALFHGRARIEVVIDEADGFEKQRFAPVARVGQAQQVGPVDGLKRPVLANFCAELVLRIVDLPYAACEALHGGQAILGRLGVGHLGQQVFQEFGKGAARPIVELIIELRQFTDELLGHDVAELPRGVVEVVGRLRRIAGVGFVEFKGYGQVFEQRLIIEMLGQAQEARQQPRHEPVAGVAFAIDGEARADEKHRLAAQYVVGQAVQLSG